MQNWKQIIVSNTYPLYAKRGNLCIHGLILYDLLLHESFCCNRLIVVIQDRVLEVEVVHRGGHVLCQEVLREDTRDQHREVRVEAFPEAHVGPVLDLVADLANPK